MRLSRTLQLAIVLLVVAISAGPSVSFAKALDEVFFSENSGDRSLQAVDADSLPAALSSNETRPTVKRLPLFSDRELKPPALTVSLRALGFATFEAPCPRFLGTFSSGGNRAPPVSL